MRHLIPGCADSALPVRLTLNIRPMYQTATPFARSTGSIWVSNGGTTPLDSPPQSVPLHHKRGTTTVITKRPPPPSPPYRKKKPTEDQWRGAVVDESRGLCLFLYLFVRGVGAASTRKSRQKLQTKDLTSVLLSKRRRVSVRVRVPQSPDEQLTARAI